MKSVIDLEMDLETNIQKHNENKNDDDIFKTVSYRKKNRTKMVLGRANNLAIKGAAR